jgi:hypothetical protein
MCNESRHIHQVCYFVRGSSCASGEVDYYLLPRDVEETYLQTIRHNERIFGLAPPPWTDGWTEQVVLLDWPVFTPAAIRTTVELITTGGSGASAGDTDTRSDHVTAISDFSPRDIEGDIFFDDQAVAIIPFHPSYVHPLMDEAIFQILKAVPELQVVIALPETYAHFLPTAIQSFAEQSSSMEKLSIQWAKQLVRRLWTTESGTSSSPLHQRIRLLPSPVSEERLLQLIKQADMVLDSFPMGGTLHPLALALSTGTPVVTLKGGIVLKTPIYDSLDIKKFLKKLYNKFHANPIYEAIVHYNSVPWLPSTSPLAALYERWHLDKELVASSISEYARIAEIIASDKNKAYELRVRILEALERHSDPEAAHSTMRDLSRYGNSTLHCTSLH